MTNLREYQRGGTVISWGVSFQSEEYEGHPVGWYAFTYQGERLVEGCKTIEEAQKRALERLEEVTR